MAKLKKNYEFKNADVSLEEGLIYEFDKDNESYETYSLESVLREMASLGRIDFSINTVTVPSSINDGQ